MAVSPAFCTTTPRRRRRAAMATCLPLFAAIVSFALVVSCAFSAVGGSSLVPPTDLVEAVDSSLCTPACGRLTNCMGRFVWNDTLGNGSYQVVETACGCEEGYTDTGALRPLRLAGESRECVFLIDARISAHTIWLGLTFITFLYSCYKLVQSIGVIRTNYGKKLQNLAEDRANANGDVQMQMQGQNLATALQQALQPPPTQPQQPDTIVSRVGRGHYRDVSRSLIGPLVEPLPFASPIKADSGGGGISSFRSRTRTHVKPSFVTSGIIGGTNAAQPRRASASGLGLMSPASVGDNSLLLSPQDDSVDFAAVLRAIKMSDPPSVKVVSRRMQLTTKPDSGRMTPCSSPRGERHASAIDELEYPISPLQRCDTGDEERQLTADDFDDESNPPTPFKPSRSLHDTTLPIAMSRASSLISATTAEAAMIMHQPRSMKFRINNSSRATPSPPWPQPPPPPSAPPQVPAPARDDSAMRTPEPTSPVSTVASLPHAHRRSIDGSLGSGDFGRSLLHASPSASPMGPSTLGLGLGDLASPSRFASASPASVQLAEQSPSDYPPSLQHRRLPMTPSILQGPATPNSENRRMPATSSPQLQYSATLASRQSPGASVRASPRHSAESPRDDTFLPRQHVRTPVPPCSPPSFDTVEAFLVSGAPPNLPVRPSTTFLPTDANGVQNNTNHCLPSTLVIPIAGTGESGQLSPSMVMQANLLNAPQALSQVGRFHSDPSFETSSLPRTRSHSSAENSSTSHDFRMSPPSTKLPIPATKRRRTLERRTSAELPSTRIRRSSSGDSPRTRAPLSARRLTERSDRKDVAHPVLGTPANIPDKPAFILGLNSQRMEKKRVGDGPGQTEATTVNHVNSSLVIGDLPASGGTTARHGGAQTSRTLVHVDVLSLKFVLECFIHIGFQYSFGAVIICIIQLVHICVQISYDSEVQSAFEVIAKPHVIGIDEFLTWSYVVPFVLFEIITHLFFGSHLKLAYSVAGLRGVTSAQLQEEISAGVVPSQPASGSLQGTLKPRPSNAELPNHHPGTRTQRAHTFGGAVTAVRTNNLLMRRINADREAACIKAYMAFHCTVTAILILTLCAAPSSPDSSDTIYIITFTAASVMIANLGVFSGIFATSLKSLLTASTLSLSPKQSIERTGVLHRLHVLIWSNRVLGFCGLVTTILLAASETIRHLAAGLLLPVLSIMLTLVLITRLWSLNWKVRSSSASTAAVAQAPITMTTTEPVLRGPAPVVVLAGTTSWRARAQREARGSGINGVVSSSVPPTALSPSPEAQEPHHHHALFAPSSAILRHPLQQNSPSLETQHISS